MAGLKRGRRSGEGAKCSRQYENLLDHIRKKHKGARFTEGEVDGTGLVACTCGAVSSNARGLAHHRKRTMCEGLEKTKRTSTVVTSRSPQPAPNSDAVSDIDSFPSSHHSRVTHVSDTQPSRVLETPQEDGQHMAMLDWDADYEMSEDEAEGFDLPNRRSTNPTPANGRYPPIATEVYRGKTGHKQGNRHPTHLIPAPALTHLHVLVPTIPRAFSEQEDSPTRRPTISRQGCRPQDPKPPEQQFPFHPLVFSLGSMMNGSTTEVFGLLQKVMTWGIYNLVLK
jgi:hypothetical protein